MQIRFALLFSMLASTAASTVLAAGLPDTGQTLCDNGAQSMVTCSSTNIGDASTVPRQDGRFGHDPAIDASQEVKTGFGQVGLDYSTIQPLKCVQDNITGLMWEVKTNDGGLRDRDWTYTWYSSDPSLSGGISFISDTGVGVGSDNCSDRSHCDTQQYVNDVNAAGLCGYNDWRMPTKRELFTIVHAGRVSPAINLGNFPNTNTAVSLGRYWSSTIYPRSPGNVYYINVNAGVVAISGGSSQEGAVRLVRGGQF